MGTLRRLELRQQRMQLAAQPRGLGQRPRPFRHEQVEPGRRVLGGNQRQRRCFPPHEQGDGPGIKSSRSCPGYAPAAGSTPSSVD
jgi:hypothetical protein